MIISKYNARTQYYFKNQEGNPFILTPGQEDIFRLIYEPEVLRGTVKATTQYGKSEVAAMAIVMAMVERKERILIIAPSIKQSSIIMGKVIEHFFDHPYLTGMLEYYGKLDQLKQERSKARLTTKNGSDVRILTAEARTVARAAKSLMGFGASIVIVDESALIPDVLFSKILRMVGGVKNGKLIQLGNPFEDNHFGRSFRSKRYEKIHIDYKQALAEGRITQEFLDEAKEEMSDLDWTVFYEVKFPKTGPEDSLIPMGWIENAVEQAGCEGDFRQAGMDIARFGNDKTIYIYRKGGEVKHIRSVEKMDTMEVVGWGRGLIDEDEPEVVAIDEIGLGGGVVDRLEELEYEVTGINVANKPSDPEMEERFFNLRAEIFWYLRRMFKPEKDGHSQISIPNDPELIKQLSEIRYKYSSEKKIKIESKDEMKKRLGSSPDKADALALAFYNTEGLQPELEIL